MKWIGQHIWDFISRFRSDVYLESVSDGTVVDDKFLGLDSDGKVVKEAVSGSVTVTDSSTNAQYPIVFHDDSNNLLDDTDQFQYNPGKSLLDVLSTVSKFPIIQLTNQTADANGPGLSLTSSRSTDNSVAGIDSDNIGTISFSGYNNAGTPEKIDFASILAYIRERDDTDEAGRLNLKVATSDGSTSALQTALSASGHGTKNVVDIALGYGAASVTGMGHITTTHDYDTVAFETQLDNNTGHGEILRYGSAQETGSAGVLHFLHTDGTWDLTDANDVNKGASQLLGISVGSDPDLHGMLIDGHFRIEQANIDGTPAIGAPVYVADDATGEFDFAAPTGNNDFVRIVGYCIDIESDDILLRFKPDNTWVKVTV